MSTARDLIEGSLRLVGALATGEAASASEASDALSALNDMLDSWSNENLLIPYKVREEFTLTPSTQSYTIGSGADFNTSRPQKIDNAGILDSGSEYVIDIINKDQWALITDKSTGSTLPTCIYVEWTYPNATINLWPVPSSANKLVLYSWKPLTTLTNLSTSISLPPGYLRALRYNLAVELAPEYGKEAQPSVMGIAAEAKANIKRMNIAPMYLDCDPAILERKIFNIFTGE